MEFREEDLSVCSQPLRDECSVAARKQSHCFLIRSRYITAPFRSCGVGFCAAGLVIKTTENYPCSEVC